jgi:hypothetical protein
MLVPISAPDSAQRCRCAEIAHGCDGHGPRRVADTQGCSFNSFDAYLGFNRSVHHATAYRYAQGKLAIQPY